MAVLLSELAVLGMTLPLFGDEQPAEVTSTERVSFAPGGTIRLDGSYGHLRVDGWHQPEVEVTLTKSSDRYYKPGQQQEAKRRLELIRVVTERRSETEFSITTIRAFRNGNWSPPLQSTTKAGVTVEYQIHAPRNW